MFTVCPKCALTLVVTAADLRVAQGYVRCGRCSSVFNALARLVDERQASGAAEADAPPHTPSAPAAQTPQPAAAEPGAEPRADVPATSGTEEEPIPEDALEFNPDKTDVSSVFVEQAPNPKWTAATGSFKALVAANQEPAPEELPDSQVEVEIDAAFLASMLKSEAAPRDVSGSTGAPASIPAAPETAAPPVPAGTHAPAAQETEPAALPAPAAGSPPAATAASAPAPRMRPGARHGAPHTRPVTGAARRASVTESAAAPKKAPVPAQPPAAEPVAALADLLDTPPAAADRDDTLRRWLPLAWRVGTVLAVLTLCAQIVNHYRDDLATSARFNRPLTAFYAAFGVHLVPRWDLRAYDVRQLGASVDPGGAGTITVRASIKNAAQQPQPLPLLRVTLQDRFGNRIASSDVAPRSYLPRAIPASSFLSAGQRIDAQMGFVDPGASAVGFELDACLPASGGGIACANDVAAR